MAKPSARIRHCAKINHLGAHIKSWRWTKYHLLLIAAWTAAVGAGITGSMVDLLSDQWGAPGEENVFAAALILALIGLVMAIGLTCFYFTFHLGRSVLAGLGRRLHLYRHGLIVSRFGRPQVYLWQDLRSIVIDQTSTPRTGTSDVSVSLDFHSSGKVVVDRVPAIGKVSEVAAQESKVKPRTTSGRSDGPDGYAASGPSDPASGSEDD